MSKKNDILEEQRRAREEFLKLKKMQQGEISAGPKPSEVAFVPRTPKEKLSNFWFQYKWHTIGIVAAVIMLAVLITQCATKTKYDLEIVYFTYTAALDDQTAKIADYFEKRASDLDGNGEVNVQVINCSIGASSTNTENRNAVYTKIQSLIVADEKAILYITDEESIKYFDNMSSDSGGLFESEPYVFGEDFYTETESEKWGRLPEGLQISCRRISDTVLDGKKNVKSYYDEANRILNGLKDENIK